MGVRRLENVAVEGVRVDESSSSRAVVDEMRDDVWERMAEGVVVNEGGGCGGLRDIVWIF